MTLMFCTYLNGMRIHAGVQIVFEAVKHVKLLQTQTLYEKVPPSF